MQKNANTIIFYKEKFYEHKSTWLNRLPYRRIDASNEINIFDNSQQLSREVNEVELHCLPSSEGEKYVAETLNKKMTVTNPFALKLLERLGYSLKSVETNRSEHKEIWPILENSVVSLLKKECINWDRDWDAYHNEQILFVGDNKYGTHKQLKGGSMFFTYGKEERKIAEQYFKGAISIDQMLELSTTILINYENNVENQSNESDRKL